MCPSSILDRLDGSPLFDIKPYIAKVDAYPDAKGGWFDEITREPGQDTGKADDRFSQ